ncbi:sodium/proline symporter [Alteromonadaceae bacterium Bs31]|nr:sodium/proline symporter [Alteromonadaceae bacterium Bs31]
MGAAEDITKIMNTVSTLTIVSFLGFLSVFLLIGLSSFFKSRGTKQDYYLADNTVRPWLVGLSAVATNNSGYMFIGVIGYTYVTGLASIWLMLGWILGDYLASLYVHSRLRQATENSNEVSYAGVLSHWYGNKHNRLQRLIGLISLVFLLAYASAQLVAGGKALHVLFNWPTWLGAVIGAIMVAVYCVAGGIRASIWTDAAQSVVMIIAMTVLLLVAIYSIGGINSAISSMQSVDGFLAWTPKDLALPGLAGGVLFAASWLFAGFSVIGQPHIMVRFMALDNIGGMHKARLWYYIWFSAFYCITTGVGLLSRVFLPDIGNFDAELALPSMALQLLHPLLVGLILAGIFAATMSTADSLVLSCSAAFTHDLLPHKIESTALIKLVTISVTACALLLALTNKQSVFSLVILAWSGLASAFAPLLLVLCLGRKPSQTASIIGCLVGLSCALAWRFMGWHSFVYEGFPAIVLGFIFIWVLSRRQ